MKKRSIVVMLISIILLTCGCENLEVPYLYGVDESTAKNVLSSNGLIPSVVYEYSDDVEKGTVIRTEPDSGEKFSKNQMIQVYISKGPSYISAVNSNITWYDIGSKQDSWEFYNPYIQDNILYIECFSVKFATSMKWRDRYNDGYIIGNASINDKFDKTVPLRAKYSKQSWKANESQSFTLEIPLGDLDIEKPTNIYLSLMANSNNRDIDVNISFTMTW